MAAPELPEVILSARPDRMVMVIKGLEPKDARRMANQAVNMAKARMPKMSLQGGAASRITPMYGQGYFGMKWQDNYVWFQENGIRAFTMNNLAGKVIPMWIDDPSGSERAKNPKAKVRVTLSGKTQILIFRKAALKGARKTVKKIDKITGEPIITMTPMSYPGAPGRIGVRQAGSPNTTPGKVAGSIANGNVGVRWRHPGLQPRFFLNNAMSQSAQRNGYLPIRVYVADSNWRGEVR